MGDPAIPRALRSNTTLQKTPSAVMPTKVHDIPQMWLTKELGEMREINFLSRSERDYFDSSAGTTFQGFAAPYAGSEKEPDWALIPNTDSLPSILVLLFNWSKRANNFVAGEVRLYERTAAGNANERFRASIFPIAQGGPAGIPVTRGEIFGVSGVFPGLQQTADRWIRTLGFVPA
ncbi:hypothetical protein BDV06DRAFT_212719 [Aspergillus oleicola]